MGGVSRSKATSDKVCGKRYEMIMFRYKNCMMSILDLCLFRKGKIARQLRSYPCS
jgi:hypothetical protein